MRVGYARVSTVEQSIEAQLERLADCEKIFHEKKTGSLATRPELTACLEFVRQGDTLVCTRLDRLARSVTHLCAIAEELERKGVALQILDQAIDSSTPAGKFLFYVLAAVAEFELTLRKEASRAGIAYARAAGKRTGRMPALTAQEVEQLITWHTAGLPNSIIARRLHISRSTVHRYIKREDGTAKPLWNKPIRINFDKAIGE